MASISGTVGGTDAYNTFLNVWNRKTSGGDSTQLDIDRFDETIMSMNQAMVSGSPPLSKKERQKQDAEFQQYFQQVWWIRQRLSHIDSLEKTTGLTKRELRALYRSFKKSCPNGFVEIQQLIIILTEYFPKGNPARFAKILLSNLDRDGNDQITFDEVASIVALLMKSTNANKIWWIFHLYDVDRDGIISREDMTEVVKSLYALVGSSVQPAITPTTVSEHVDFVFERFDKDKDGKIHFDEFVEYCSNDGFVSSGVRMFSDIFSLDMSQLVPDGNEPSSYQTCLLSKSQISTETCTSEQLDSETTCLVTPNGNNRHFSQSGREMYTARE